MNNSKSNNLSCLYSKLRNHESHNLQAVFRLRIQDTKERSCSQAFVVETVKTGNKNRDDFHCMQMTRLVMSMWFIFGDD